MILNEILFILFTIICIMGALCHGHNQNHDNLKQYIDGF